MTRGRSSAAGAAALESAKQEADRRVAARDQRELARHEHHQRFGRLFDAINAAIDAVDAAFGPNEDGARQAVKDGLVSALRAIPQRDTGYPEFDIKPPARLPAVSPGPSHGFTPDELEHMLAQALLRREQAISAGRDVLIANADTAVERLRAALQATREAGISTEQVEQQRLERAKDIDARIKFQQAQLEALLHAPVRAAQANESIEIVTARVLIERGCSPYEATCAVFGLDKDEARDTPERKRVDRARARELDRAAPPPEPAAEKRIEWEAAIEARDRLRETKR